MRYDMHVDFIGQDLQEQPWKTIPRQKFPSRYQHIFMAIVIHVENLVIKL